MSNLFQTWPDLTIADNRQIDLFSQKHFLKIVRKNGNLKRSYFAG